jgi:tetratricopeptide (TPR) repeat protein
MSRRSKNKQRASAPTGQPTSPARNATRPGPGAPSDSRYRLAPVAICVSLAAIVWFVFGQARGFGFVNFDDDRYVYDNPRITGGLNPASIRWAFTRFHEFNWHPLTTLSHLLDCQWHGLDPRWHHLDNVILHACAAILLFLALRSLTGTLWRSAFVAAVFAVHPLHVESVAWISERKDVLSGAFFALTLWAYGRYARTRPGNPATSDVKPASNRWFSYAAVLLCSALALMSKPTMVTLPFVLLLLDWWPLQRLRGTAPAHWLPLVLEKIPIFAMAAAVCVLTLLAQRGAAETGAKNPLSCLAGNAVISYAVYLGQMLWPANLSALYPFRCEIVTAWKVAAAAVLLAGISAVACVQWKKRPWLPVGWLWYLGILVPMIGLVQVGIQSHADRYTYLSQIGLYVLVAWTAAEWFARWQLPAWLPAVLSAAVIGALALMARTQASYWHDSLTLWRHAIDCTEANAPAHNNLGIELDRLGRLNEAMAEYQKAVEINPAYTEAHSNIGVILEKRGQSAEAIAEYQKALEINPLYVKAMDDLGVALQQEGRLDDAIALYRRTIEIDPSHAPGHYNLAIALTLKNRTDEAIAEYEQALEINPRYAEAHINLGIALERNGKRDAASAQYEQALAINPDSPEALIDLAYVLVTAPNDRAQNGARALALSQKANQLTGGRNPVVLGTLAASYASQGRFADAVDCQQRAIDLAQAQGKSALAAQLQQEIKLYQANRPLNEGP